MTALRAMIHAHARLALVLLALALAVKAVVPAGMMLAPAAERFLTVTICSDATGLPKQMQIALPAKHADTGDAAEAASKSQHCAFAGLGHDALGGADLLLLAGAIAFILLRGLAPLPAFPQRGHLFCARPFAAPDQVSDHLSPDALVRRIAF